MQKGRDPEGGRFSGLDRARPTTNKLSFMKLIYNCLIVFLYFLHLHFKREGDALILNFKLGEGNATCTLHPLVQFKQNMKKKQK